MVKYRKANMDDMDQLINLRKKQLVDEGIEPNIDSDTELYVYFKNKLSDGSLIQWLVEENEPQKITFIIEICGWQNLMSAYC